MRGLVVAGEPPEGSVWHQLHLRPRDTLTAVTYRDTDGEARIITEPAGDMLDRIVAGGDMTLTLKLEQYGEKVNVGVCVVTEKFDCDVSAP